MPWPKFWSSSGSTSPTNDSVNESATSSVAEAKQKAEEAAATLEAKASNAVNSARNAISNVNPSSDSFVTSLFDSRTLVPTAILTATILALVALRHRFLRRYPNSRSIPNAYNILSKRKFTRSLLGRVTSVGDADNFRLFHTPLGRVALWDTPLRRTPTDSKNLKNNTIHIRLAGVDAPEAAHFGKPAQPYSKEALDWLTGYVKGRRVRCYVHKQDQYSRTVATVYLRRGLLRRDVGLEMLKAGWATVYDAKVGAVFAGEGTEKKYRAAEETAKHKGRGMWKHGVEAVETPQEYKKRHRETAVNNVGEGG